MSEASNSFAPTDDEMASLGALSLIAMSVLGVLGFIQIALVVF